MGKRYTETTKWNDTWFRSLTTPQKCAWQYLCDNCDIAGVIDVDRELANFQIRDTLDWDAFVEAAGERLVRLKSGKLWVARFIRFQYGHDFPSSSIPHRAVLKLLDRYAESERVIEQYRRDLPVPKDEGKDKDKAKDNSSRKGSAEGKPKFSATDVPVPAGFDCDEVRATIRDWMAYKASRGEGYKDPAYLGRKVAEFAGAGVQAFISAVNSSIGSNYAGLFPVKGTNGQPTASRVGSGQRHRG